MAIFSNFLRPGQPAFRLFSALRLQEGFALRQNPNLLADIGVEPE